MNSKEKILELIPNRLVEILNLNLNNVPVLKEETHFIGTSNNPDNIQIDDTSSPISIGIDRYERPFIAIRLRNQDTKEATVITLFQQYYNMSLPWKATTCYKNFLNFHLPVLNVYGEFMLDKYYVALRSLGKYGYANKNNETFELW